MKNLFLIYGYFAFIFISYHPYSQAEEFFLNQKITNLQLNFQYPLGQVEVEHFFYTSDEGKEYDIPFLKGQISRVDGIWKLTPEQREQQTDINFGILSPLIQKCEQFNLSQLNFQTLNKSLTFFWDTMIRSCGQQLTEVLGFDLKCEGNPVTQNLSIKEKGKEKEKEKYLNHCLNGQTTVNINKVRNESLNKSIAYILNNGRSEEKGIFPNSLKNLVMTIEQNKFAIDFAVDSFFPLYGSSHGEISYIPETKMLVIKVDDLWVGLLGFRGSLFQMLKTNLRDSQIKIDEPYIYIQTF